MASKTRKLPGNSVFKLRERGGAGGGRHIGNTGIVKIPYHLKDKKLNPMKGINLTGKLMQELTRPSNQRGI
jgi:hypothetical protein